MRVARLLVNTPPAWEGAAGWEAGNGQRESREGVFTKCWWGALLSPSFTVQQLGTVWGEEGWQLLARWREAGRIRHTRGGS